MELDIGTVTPGIGIMTSNERIARLHIKLDHIEPVIWRRVEVPITTSLKGLHDVIQAVMLFKDYHLFEFNAGGKRYAVPDPEWDFGADTYAARNVRIGALVDRGITIPMTSATTGGTQSLSRPSRTPIRQSNIRASSTATGARRRKMSAACPASKTSSSQCQSHDMHNIAKSWTGMAVASSRMILASIRSMSG